MAGRRGTQSRPARARATAAALPHGAGLGALARLAPSRRSLAVGLGLLALAVGAYYTARESSAFAIDRVDVSGAPPAVRAQVRAAVAPLRGTSLLALDGAALERRVEALPTVVSARYDRAFPHTLRLSVVPERAVAALRRGPDTWIVSARGRVIRHVPTGSHGALPRIWVSRATAVEVGGLLDADGGGAAARSLALATRFPARIATAVLVHGGLVYRLRSGLELRLGAPADIRLKLAIARRALAQLPAGSVYLDVSVPGRPVAGSNPKFSSRG